MHSEKKRLTAAAAFGGGAVRPASHNLEMDANDADDADADPITNMKAAAAAEPG